MLSTIREKKKSICNVMFCCFDVENYKIYSEQFK